MNRKKTKSIICSACKHEIASEFRKKDGSTEVKINGDLAIKVIDPKNNLGAIICQKCGNEMKTNLDIFKTSH